ncbi:hypothetical protein MTO96_013694 [Rhipicephalus appendiculatus]
MPVAVIFWDVSTVSDSGVAFANSPTGLFVAVYALYALPTIKVPRKDRMPIASCGMALSSGPQAALKRFLAGTMGNLRLGSHGVRGRERCEGHSRKGPFGAVLADDSLLTIKTPLRVLRSVGDACWITLLPNGPQAGLTTFLADTVTNSLFQINFFQGHTKLILCPLMAAVTYVDNNRAFHTSRPERLHNGCPPELCGWQPTARRDANASVARVPSASCPSW